MTRKESDFLQFENELLHTRQRLNALIQEYTAEAQSPENAAVYRDKLCYFETELRYLNNQLQLLKQLQPASPEAEYPKTGQTAGNPQIRTEAAGAAAPVPTALQAKKLPDYAAPRFPAKAIRKDPRDYEKIFGRNFMGIFASVLIFISLIIFATLMLPYLTDTLKLLGLYLISFGILLTGYLLFQRDGNNKFYIALIGCGVGSLYISLLLSDLYFKVIGDLALYLLILVWAVFVKRLTKIRTLVFHIIGQAGILIAAILGTALCVHDVDEKKFFALTIFYFISAFVFTCRSGRPISVQAHLSGSLPAEEKQDCPLFYERRLCDHICTSLNLMVFTIGFACIKQASMDLTIFRSFTEQTALLTINVLVVMLYLLAVFYFSYKEEWRHGLVFQLLTVVNAVILVCLFDLTDLFTDDWTYAFLYVVSLAVLFYTHKKDAEYGILSEVCCFIMIYLGCQNNSFISGHLYAYLTVVPFMVYGILKDKKQYLYAGLAFTAELFLLAFSADRYGEYLIMTAAVYFVFLFVCKRTDQTLFKIFGYILLSLTLMVLLHESTYQFLKTFNSEHAGSIEYIGTKANLIPFFLLAVIHLILTRLEYFGTEKPVVNMMLVINALLMTAGCIGIHGRPWKHATIMLTALLFAINSQRLFRRNQNAGYYIAIKYTAFMVCVLTSYDVVDYVISISLLLFAIVSIVVGFYKDTITFRLYGLILSMISVVKLIMIDIKYDSTVENAVSFFVCGVLCFAISFIYHKIDTNLKNK